eukprot:TRINITY_DN1638_c0_g1_i1.p1 TRINITY_DN1638_c0_g1~~TRINITY_DN1638_c0_g1_i1.p1  ORF type:complete len:186 (-),score=20.08 TRINITY_DN1638_c0_g1_i1:83-598(-)
MSAKLIDELDVADECWDAYNAVFKARTTGALAAVFGMSDDEKSIVLVGTVSLNDAHPWPALVALLDEQKLSWIVLMLPYKTDEGEQSANRERFVFIRWVADALRRETHKETIRVKSGAVMLAGKLASKAHTDGAIKYQANDFDDMKLEYVLDASTKTERAGVLKSSLDVLR